MKFKKLFDSEATKRKRLAAQALAEIRRLDDAKYPLAMLFDRVPATAVDRQTGESWPQAYGRKLGLELQQLRDFAAGLIETGLYQTNSPEVPTAKDLHNYFVGWSVLLIATEQELSASRGN